MTNDWDWESDEEESDQSWTSSKYLSTFYLPKRHRDFFQFQLWHLVQYDKVMKEFRLQCKDKVGLFHEVQPSTSSGLSSGLHYQAEDFPMMSCDEEEEEKRRRLGPFSQSNYSLNQTGEGDYNFNQREFYYNNRTNTIQTRSLRKSWSNTRLRHSNRKLDQYKTPQSSALISSISSSPPENVKCYTRSKRKIQ